MAVDLSVFGRLKTKADFDREAEAWALAKREKMLARMGSSPASVQLANEIQKARASGDVQRVNDLIGAAKLYDRGVVMDESGNPIAMGGYGDAIGSIAGTKKAYETQGQKGVELIMNPQIAGNVATAEADVKARTAPKIEYDTKRASINAETRATAERNLPNAEVNAQAMSDLLNQIKTSPGLSASVGMPNPLKGRIPFVGNVAGSPAADFQAKLDQLGGKQFLEAFQSLKGGGQITEVEGQKATNAIGRMQTSQSEKEFLKALDELQGVVNIGLDRARAGARGNINRPQEDIAETLFNARKALKKGADPEAVRARLIENGIDPTQAGL